MSENIIVDVDSLTHDGRGVAHIDGKAIFIHGALPGERVEIELIKKRRKRDEAKLVEVIVASDHRVTPFCKHFSICGGCAIQHIDSQQQISYKQETHINNMKKISALECGDIMPPLFGSAFFYRRRARLGVKYVTKKQRVLVGFREKTHHYLADIEYCPVLVEKFAEQIVNLQNLMEKLEAYNKIPQIEVSAGDNRCAIILRHLVDLSEKDVNFLRVFAETEGIDIYSQRSGPASIKPLWPAKTETLFYRLINYDIKIYFHPADFIQVNGEMNNKMIAKALELLDLQATDRVLDLFCGIGNFSLPIAKYCQQLIGIEGEANLVRRAQENAKTNLIENVEFLQADLRQETEFLREQKLDKILLDPPRSGALEILPQITALSAEKIVYVSCNSATFARDAGELAKLGYELQCTGVMDMFPQTAHVECISLFVKK